MRTPFVSNSGCLAFVALIGGIPPALAQDHQHLETADPRAAAVAPKAESAFRNYQPFQDQPVRSWQQANQDVADAAPKSGEAHQGHAGTTGGPGTDSQPGAAHHGMGGAKNMPAAAPKSGKTHQGHAGATSHGMAATRGMPAKPKPAAEATKERVPHGSMAAARTAARTDAHTAAHGHDGNAERARLAGTGLVQAVDKAHGRVKLTHDPIASMRWPRMTLVFRLKDHSLADRVRKGDRVAFSLEKSPTGYVISHLQRSAVGPDRNQAR